MSFQANNTLLLDEPVARGVLQPRVPATTTRTDDLARIVRRALRNPRSDTALSRAIRSAAAEVTPNLPHSPSEDEALRVRTLASRMNALLTQPGTVARHGSPHAETVHN